MTSKIKILKFILHYLIRIFLTCIRMYYVLGIFWVIFFIEWNFVFNSSLLSSLPLIVLGLGRVLSTKGVNYQEHVTEYGVHWNFFFTVSAVKVKQHKICTDSTIFYNLYKCHFKKTMASRLMELLLKQIKKWCWI